MAGNRLRCLGLCERDDGCLRGRDELTLPLRFRRETRVSALDYGDVEEHDGHEDGHTSVPHRGPRDGQGDMFEDDADEEHNVESRADTEDRSTWHDLADVKTREKTE